HQPKLITGLKRFRYHFKDSSQSVVGEDTDHGGRLVSDRRRTPTTAAARAVIAEGHRPRLQI
ncbi:MAG: hypothetical protein V4722_22720, partial [Bacteroidota bacterium]